VNEVPNRFNDASTHGLIDILLTNRDEDEGGSVYWEAMWAIRRRATAEVFGSARSLCEGECPLEQCIGCDILAQLGGAERPYATQSFPIVASVLANASDLDCLTSAISALGWLGDLRGVDMLLPFLNHVDADVRYWITQSLSALHNDPRSIAGLIRLTTDSSVEVRDWSTFGLGSLCDEDSREIRDALVARLADDDSIVRGEALAGLAKRQDLRVVEPLLQAFEAGTYDHGISDFAQDALDELQCLDKYPQLLKWKTNA
jgi:HEAT repeat protein